MTIRHSRFLAYLFALFIVVMPQASAFAANQELVATPVTETTPIEAPATEPVDEVDTGTDAELPETVEPAGTPDASGGPVQPLALAPGAVNLWIPWYNTSTGMLEVNGDVYADAVISAGDSITLFYTNDTLVLNETPISFDSGTGLRGHVQADQATGSIVYTFDEDFVASDGIVNFHADLPGTVVYPACAETERGYYNYTEIQYFSDGSPRATQSVSGPWCQGTGLPEITWIDFDPVFQQLRVQIDLPSIPGAGHQITIEYPAELISIDSTPVEFYVWSPETQTDVLIATGVASDGIITITFEDVGGETFPYANTSSSFRANLNNAVCDPSGGVYVEGVGDIEFVASTGYTQSIYLESRLCNAAAPTKSGVLSEDGTRITWTIDTGDILSGVWVEDFGGIYGFLFDCSTLTVTPTNPDLYVETGCWDDYSPSFNVAVYGDESDMVRAVITVESIIDPESQFPFPIYLNCAIVGSMNNGGGVEVRAAEADGSGYGEPVCAEVFPEDGGDYITKTVSSDAVQNGDELTYTINVSTTSFLWFTIDLVDPLPEGFVVTGVTCSVTPDQFQADPCYVNTDGVITVSAVSGLGTDPGFEPYLGTVSIDVVIEGYVDAAPGTVIVNEACSERKFDILLATGPSRAAQSMGDPTILGGGEICASTSTTVLADPELPVTPSPTATVSPTATPSPTVAPELPATPSASPTPAGTPSASSSPVATQESGVTPSASVETTVTGSSAVTGLPNTGTGERGSNIGVLLVVAAAGIMLAILGGTRLRSERQ